MNTCCPDPDQPRWEHYLPPCRYKTCLGCDIVKDSKGFLTMLEDVFHRRYHIFRQRALSNGEPGPGLGTPLYPTSPEMKSILHNLGGLGRALRRILRLQQSGYDLGDHPGARYVVCEDCQIIGAFKNLAWEAFMLLDNTWFNSFSRLRSFWPGARDYNQNETLLLPKEHSHSDFHKPYLKLKNALEYDKLRREVTLKEVQP